MKIEMKVKVKVNSKRWWVLPYKTYKTYKGTLYALNSLYDSKFI